MRRVRRKTQRISRTLAFPGSKRPAGQGGSDATILGAYDQHATAGVSQKRPRLGFLKSGQHPRFVLILPATLLCLALMNPAYAAQRHSAGKPPVKPEQPAPTPQPVPPPLTLEQMPSSPPQVSFRNGQLTIVAQNSTLGDILRGVRKQT